MKRPALTILLAVALPVVCATAWAETVYIRAGRLIDIDDGKRRADQAIVVENGRIAPGYRADLIAVAGDPLEEIETLERVAFVMKGGRIYKSP